MVCATSEASDQPVPMQFGQSLCLLLEFSMTVGLLSDRHLEFLSLRGGCAGSSGSAFVRVPHC